MSDDAGGNPVPAGAAPSSAVERPCTCHPDEAPVPCQRQYALLDCHDAARNVSITVGGSTHTRTAQQWLELARADLRAQRSSIESMLLDEIDQALDELGAQHEIVNGDGMRLSRVGRIRSLARSATATADAKDAARYRWLRDRSVPPHNFYLSVPVEFKDDRYTPQQVDAAIDAAIGPDSRNSEVPK